MNLKHRVRIHPSGESTWIVTCSNGACGVRGVLAVIVGPTAKQDAKDVKKEHLREVGST